MTASSLHVHTPRVIALDASTTKAGIAYPDGRLDTLKPPPKAKGGDRLLWWQTTYEVIFADHRPNVVVVEDSFSRHMAATKVLQQAQGVLLAAIAGTGAVLQAPKPTQLKKAATGNGNASKADMIAAAQALGFDPANDDEADAALLFWGAHQGWWV